MESEGLQIMSVEEGKVPGNVPRGLDALILPSPLGPKALMEWMEQARHFLYVGGLILGADAAAVNAKLSKARGMPVVGGMTQRYRANKVSKPIGHAAEALISGVQYLQYAGDQLEAAYQPELAAIGFQPTPSGWDWKR
jgi:hypothetical protein